MLLQILYLATDDSIIVDGKEIKIYAKANAA